MQQKDAFANPTGKLAMNIMQTMPKKMVKGTKKQLDIDEGIF